MIVRYALRRPHGRGPRVVAEHVEDPRLVLVDDREPLAALAHRQLSARPVRRVEALRRGQVAHDLDCLASRGRAFQCNAEKITLTS